MPKYDSNQSKYNSFHIVSEYASRRSLQLSESVLFDRYIAPTGLDILDLGVGCGRTTSFLAPHARSYIGIDYSLRMIESCRSTYPDLEFHNLDATDLSHFASESFDIVVFSFNGIDYLTDDQSRKKHLMEVSRVLRPDGVFIFSSHNARALGVWPLYDGQLLKYIWRIIYSLIKSLKLSLRSLSSASFYSGEGYIHDPEFGGMNIYVSTPRTIAPQLRSAGFQVLECMRAPSPYIPLDCLTPWFYFACRRLSLK